MHELSFPLVVLACVGVLSWVRRRIEARALRLEVIDVDDAAPEARAILLDAFGRSGLPN